MTASKPKLTDAEQEAAVTKAIRNGASDIYMISIATGLDYSRVMRLVLRGMAARRYRLSVHEPDGRKSGT